MGEQSAGDGCGFSRVLAGMWWFVDGDEWFTMDVHCVCRYVCCFSCFSFHSFQGLMPTTYGYCRPKTQPQVMQMLTERSMLQDEVSDRSLAAMDSQEVNRNMAMMVMKVGTRQVEVFRNQKERD